MSNLSIPEEQHIMAKVLSGTYRAPNIPLPKMGPGKDYPLLLPDREPYRVDF